MRPVIWCGLIMLAIPLASCKTTGSGATDPALVACASYKPVYWSKSDTPETVSQIKEHNAAWKALCGGIK
jgi:hypothetical protein